MNAAGEQDIASAAQEARERMAERAQVDAARVEALYRFATPAYATTVIIAGFMMVLLWRPLTADALSVWFAGVIAATAARIALHWFFVRTPAGRRDPATWEWRFAIGAFAAGCLWAYVPVVFFPASEPVLQAVLVFVVVGSGLGAVGVYGSSMPAFFAFVLLPLVSTILVLATQPGRAYQLLAMMVVVFATVAVWVYRGIHRNFIEMLRNRMRNESLSARLAASESRMRDAIESFPECVAVFDGHGRLVICNDAYAAIYGGGMTAARLAGASYREIAANAYEAEVPDADHAAGFEAWLQERMRRRQESAGNARLYQLRDGRWLHGRFDRTRGGGSISMFTDITELKRSQDAYRGLQEEENLILETLPVGVAFVRDRIITRCNAMLERMLGFETGELAGRPVRDLYWSEENWRQGEDFYDRLADGRVFEIEGPLRMKDGGRKWVRMQMRATDPRAPRDSAILAFMDVSERREAETSLRRSEAMYRNLVETSNDLIWSLDRDGRWTYVNAAAARRIYGREPAELLGKSFREVLAPQVLERDVAVFERVMNGEAIYNYETRHLRKDGSHVDLAFNAIALRKTRGAVTGTTGTARDVTEEKLAAAALHESVEKLRLAADAADLYYWEWDLDADTFEWGRDPSGLVGAPGSRGAAWPDLRELLHPDDRERCFAAAQAAVESGDNYHCEFRILTARGDTRWLSAEGKVMRGREGSARRMFGAARDTTDAKRQEEEVRFLAYHDTLTGLPNRRLLDDRLKQAVYLAQRRDAHVGVMLVDLDDFKQVNDTLGHRAGDSVLREVSRRLAGCIRKADTLARHGGDEFVIVMPDLGMDGDCQVVAEKILRALEPECAIDGRAFRIGASIGISLFPADAGDGETLLRNADAAMYRAKQLGRNNYRFYGR